MLARYGRDGSVTVRWRSPRPMSAAALAGCDGAEVFVKRHHTLVRTAAQLGAEHALAGHLRALGIPVPAVLRLPDGGTTVRSGDYVYEVHAPAGGIDLYRDVPSWEPFRARGARPGGGSRAGPVPPGQRELRPAGQAPRGAHELLRGHHGAGPACRGGPPGRPPARPGPLPGRTAVAGRPRQIPPARDRPARAAAPRPRPALGARGLASVQPHLDRAVPGCRCRRRDRPRAGQPHLRGARPGGRDRAQRRVLARPRRHRGGRTRTSRPWTPCWTVTRRSGRSPGPSLRRCPGCSRSSHLEYALSEVEYFASVVRSPQNADLAYDGYLIGHARWFAGREGSALLSHLRQRADRRPAAP